VPAAEAQVRWAAPEVTLRAVRISLMTLFMACSLVSLARAGQGDSHFIRVLALDCEIEVPAYFTVRTQDTGSVSFFSPRSDEVARIRLSAPSEPDSSSARVRTISSRTEGHLQIAKKEFVGFVGQPDREPLPFVEVRSRSQQAVFYGDAIKLVDEVVKHCLATIRLAKRESYEHRTAGCAYDLTLHPTYDFVFDSAKSLSVFTDGSLSAWSLSSIQPGGVLDRHGIKDGDRVIAICGVRLAVATSSGGSICCSSGSPDALSLTIKRDSGTLFDVSISRKSE